MLVARTRIKTPVLVDDSFYQVVILGGGPAGSSCALALARMGIQSVLLVEAGEYKQFIIGESIPPETRPILAQLGILDKFLAEGHDPCYGSRSYWGDDRRGHNDSLFSVYGHGWHLDRCRFNSFLARQAQAAGVDLATRSSFLHARRLADGRFCLGIEDAEDKQVSITTDCVVDATGIRGVFARQQGCQKISSLPLISSAALFSLRNRHQRIPPVTHLEAVEYGWWYVAPLPKERLLVMLTTDVQMHKVRNLNRAEPWFDLLAQTPNTLTWIGKADRIDACQRVYAAPSFRLNRTAGHRWLAVGDAASAFDPITSQGIIKALSDGLVAAETIVPWLARQEYGFEHFGRTNAARYEQYVGMRRYFYQLENRWSESPFWHRLQAV